MRCVYDKTNFFIVQKLYKVVWTITFCLGVYYISFSHFLNHFLVTNILVLPRKLKNLFYYLLYGVQTNRKEVKNGTKLMMNLVCFFIVTKKY